MLRIIWMDLESDLRERTSKAAASNYPLVLCGQFLVKKTGLYKKGFIASKHCQEEDVYNIFIDGKSPM